MFISKELLIDFMQIIDDYYEANYISKEKAKNTESILKNTFFSQICHDSTEEHIFINKNRIAHYKR
jgi:hypothetical protein